MSWPTCPCNRRLGTLLCGAEELQVADYGLGSPGPAGDPNPGSLALDGREAELLNTTARTKVEAGDWTAAAFHCSRRNDHHFELYGSDRVRVTSINFHPGDNERAGERKLQYEIDIVVWILELDIGRWVAVEQNRQRKFLVRVLTRGG